MQRWPDSLHWLELSKQRWQARNRVRVELRAIHEFSKRYPNIRSKTSHSTNLKTRRKEIPKMARAKIINLLNLPMKLPCKLKVSDLIIACNSGFENHREGDISRRTKKKGTDTKYDLEEGDLERGTRRNGCFSWSNTLRAGWIGCGEPKKFPWSKWETEVRKKWNPPDLHAAFDCCILIEEQWKDHLHGKQMLLASTSIDLAIRPTPLTQKEDPLVLSLWRRTAKLKSEQELFCAWQTVHMAVGFTACVSARGISRKQEEARPNL